MNSVIILIAMFVAVLGLAYAAFNFFGVKKLDEGTERMSKIAGAIRVGANAFIDYEYKMLAIVVVIVAIVFALLVSWQTAVCFLLGAVMSASAGFVGMKIATYANVRVANTARTTKNIGSTLKVAFKGGSVMGICVGCCGMVGLCLVYLIFGLGLGMMESSADGAVTSGLLKISIIPFTMCLSGYALGCSIVAMFNRVGGGIYTKAADMGADLVGKTEANIPEDDPRNPATIADNVGDNVGDVAGLGSDLLESYIGAITATMMLGVHVFLSSNANGLGIGTEMLSRLMLFPMLFAAGGILSCLIGIASLLMKKDCKDPHKSLNFATYVSAILTMVIGLGVTFFMFRGQTADILKNAGFKVGIVSPWIGAAIGIIAGIIIGAIAEFYTSYDYNPTKKISNSAKEGSALVITEGMAVGMISCMAPVIVLGLSLVIAYYTAGIYGVAMAGVGMLSFVCVTVSVDTYGPISDNSGGIAEMSFLEPEVREITDQLDAVGNTTAAIGKGFAIGSATFAALSMIISYLYTFNDIGADVVFNMVNPLCLAGVIIGAALPFLFSGMLIEAVAKAARKMVDEVRRQFKADPGILEGTSDPDYKTCITISSQGALKEMKVPCILAIVFPLLTGFIFGPNFTGGILLGATLSAIMLAIFTGNAGGAWDNAKKFIEIGGVEGASKGTEAHAAAVVGDTVGDPLKDTVGPSLDILIKIMSTVSLVAVGIFAKYNVFDWIIGLIK